MELIHDQTLNTQVGVTDENLPSVNKAKHPKNGEKKVQDDEGPKSWQKEDTTNKRQITRATWTNQVLKPSCKPISNKERGGTHARTLSLEEPSPVVIACLEIEATYTCCNAIDTFCM